MTTGPSGAFLFAQAATGLGGAFAVAFILLGILLVTAHVADMPRLSRVLVPVIGLFGTIGFRAGTCSHATPTSRGSGGS